MSSGIVPAKWADGPALENGERVTAVVGNTLFKRPVTGITVNTDEPGQLCFMRRVIVWSGDEMLCEWPMIGSGGVGYV
jgi:hypothetical protein